MHIDQRYETQLDAFLTSEMAFIKTRLHGLEMNSHPEAEDAACRLQIVYQYMLDRLISSNLKNNKRLN